MKFNSLVTEEVPTPTRKIIYKPGCLQHIKEQLQPFIDKKICFVIVKNHVSSLSPEVINQDCSLKDGLFKGLVTNIDIINGNAIVDIEFVLAEESDFDPQEYKVEFLFEVDEIPEELVKENIKNVSNVVKLRNDL